MKQKFQTLSLLLLCISTLLILPAASGDHSDNDLLFRITRNSDCHQVYYDLKHDRKGKVDLTDPIDVYWMRSGTTVYREELNWLQKKLAYGLTYFNKTDSGISFRFVSYAGRNFHLKQDRSGRYQVYTEFRSKRHILKRINLQIKGGSLRFPKISKVQLFMHEPGRINEVIETITPQN